MDYGMSDAFENVLKISKTSKGCPEKRRKYRDNVVIPKHLAKIANKNLSIGNCSSIQSSQLDLRNPLRIGNQVIIGGVIK